MLRLVSRNREALENELSHKQLELLEKYNISVNEMNAASEVAAFKSGFRIAISLIMELVQA